MREFFEAIAAMLLFRRHTVAPRWIEIGLGVITWVALAIIAWGLYMQSTFPAQVVIPAPRPIVSHTDDYYDPCFDNIDSLYHDLPNRKRRIDSLAAGKKARIERNIAIQDSVEALNTK